MLYSFAHRFQKPTAWCLLFIFYFQLLGSAYAASVASSGYRQYLLPLTDNRKVPAKNTGTVESTLGTPAGLTPDITVPAGMSKGMAIFPASSNVLPVAEVPVPEVITESGPGPTQPEMQSFKSVGADNMVDLFSGDLSYNIPLLDVGGYPVSIHYNSGITMDQEASWVGLGWNINPGVINRNVRGLPDDFDGTDVITKEQNVKKNRTIGGSVSKTIEIFGKKIPGLKMGMQVGLFHNSYKGWGVEYGVTPSMRMSVFSKGTMTAGLSVGNNNQTGLDVSPSFSVGVSSKGVKSVGLDLNIGSNYNSRTGISALQMNVQGTFSKEGAAVANGELMNGKADISFPVGGISFVKPSFNPSISMPYTSESYTFSLQPGRYKKFTLKTYGTITGYTSENYIAPEDRKQEIPAYGYLYYQKAKNQGDRVLMDFNRDKEVPFRPTTPHIAVPSYTYDLYSISGEGTGGSFRPYRGDIGFVFDHTNRTKSKSSNLGADFGFGRDGYAQFGVDIDKTDNQTTSGPWKTGSNLLAPRIGFKAEDNSITEPVYFKNQGEKTKADKNYLAAIGDTDLVNISLVGIGSSNSSDPVLNSSLNRYKNQVFTGSLPFNNDTYRKERDKRTQVISYLNAELAAKFAIDTLIKAYELNAIPSLGCNTNYQTIKRNDGYRKPNHLSEITVLNTDGRRYIYGVPAYNTKQLEVTFAVNKSNVNTETQLVSYSAGDNSTANTVENTDHFFSKEETPGYAHSFLLSSILSPDYVDMTGNGVSEDDQGDAIKFNYSRVYAGGSGAYRWRAPYPEFKAAYNEGLKSDKRDDRGSYTYGEKEIWYLNSLESKNMIASFVVETDPSKVRKDVYGTSGENGGIDLSQKMYQLKEINLYSKADLIKYGAGNAKPIKTVHFEYDYSLCKGHPGATASNIGKLTLRKIWFTYNKNDKGVQNPYVFFYDKDTKDGSGNLTGNNSPTYNNKSYDRWGNYKTAAENIGSLSNTDFPYATQVAATANENAAAWSLNEILLPSGGKLKVTYEADDYAWVQNKRSMQMMEVAGFGKNASDVPQNKLYHFTGLNSSIDCDYIFIKVPQQVNTKEEVRRKYLEGISKVFVKFSMVVPADLWGSGSEMVPCYVEAEDFGVTTNPADKIIWIKAKPLDGKNPFLLAATQFLRMNLYSKAYPYSEPGDNMTVKSFLQAIGSVAGNIKNATAGFYNYTISEKRCREVETARSFVRLNNPSYKKYGGGHRVKKVEITDNWNKMTGPSNNLTSSTYGQEYDYSSTIKDETGTSLTISSGVASYEPMVGREENPFTVPSDPYKEQVGLLAPTDYFYVDEPLMESFYPAAIVGYSKVRVSSISKTTKSASGFTETEFYTSKDFPVTSSYTPLLEGQTKYTYQNPRPNKLSFFNFNAKSYVTLTQGFKVSLNDMNGKVKRTATYAQNDPENPINTSVNYYRLENDRLEKRLSSKVDMIDSANGIITKDAEMGKDVEVMVDLREQLSVTKSSSKQFNLLLQRVSAPVFVLPIPIMIMYNKSEINRYRSAAITKVVSQYAILDSVVVTDKGSKVTTRNMLFDSETGEALLTRTNNEFDDPIYNFSYPAHWAYSGMSSAYKNIQKTLFKQQLTNGVLRERSYEKLFESGDEIILTEKHPVKTVADVIVTGKYTTTTRKIWAIEAAKGMENHKGIYFIDADGEPVTSIANEMSEMMIVRSGKRNLVAAGAGSITAMANPVKLVSSDYRVVFDSNSHVINAAAGRYKDFWRIDSTATLADTCYKVIDSAIVILPITRSLLVKRMASNQSPEGVDRPSVFSPVNISATFQQLDRSRSRSNNLSTKTLMDFDTKKIPAGATITFARMQAIAIPLHDTTKGMPLPTTWIYLNNDPDNRNNTAAHYNFGGTTSAGNAITLTRILNNWDANTTFSQVISAPDNLPSSIILPTVGNQSCVTSDLTDKDITGLVQSLVDNPDKSHGILMSLANYGVNRNKDDERRSRSYYSGLKPGFSVNNDCYLTKDGFPQARLWVGYKYLRDTCVLSCKPAIKPAGVNPYRFGVFGNWRMDRAYSYYDSRKESDATIETNIRRDGEIKNFLPYWDFSTVRLKNEYADTMVRWVWNSQTDLFNRKGTEVQNSDPLYRYNSAQYGYNKHLPVAVAQNSKARNMVFDGFEDYDYKTSYCEAVCETYSCLPVVTDSKLTNCDTLSGAITSFLNIVSPPNPVISRDGNGCDLTSWGFPQCPVGSGQTYSFQSMFSNGKVSYPDSGNSASQYQLGYKRNVCYSGKGATYEVNFKSIPITGYTPVRVFFVMSMNGAVLDFRIGQGSNPGAVAVSGFSTVYRSDLKYDFTTGFNTLKLVFDASDTIGVYVNNSLLGKVGIPQPGYHLAWPVNMPTIQMEQSRASVDWIRFSDGYGNVMVDEQFNGGCATFAMPKPNFDCGPVKPDCTSGFTNYFNSKFKTTYSYAQIAMLYRQCGITTGPCGDTFPLCDITDTLTTHVSGFDRFADFTRGGGVRTTEQKHSGKYSIRINANKTAGNVVPVITTAQDTAKTTVSIKIDTVNAGYSMVYPKGKGLLTRYNVYRAFLGTNTCMRATFFTPRWNDHVQYGNIDTDWGLGSPQQFDPNQFCAPDYFGVEYTGKLQPEYTAKYVFRINKGNDDQVLMYINNNAVNFSLRNGEWKTDSIALSSCTLYNFKLGYTESKDDAKCILLWSNPYAPEPTVVATRNFYSPTMSASDSVGSCVPVGKYVKMNPVKTTNMYNPLFSPLAGTKLLVGGWVKESAVCYTGSYLLSGIDISFGNSSTFFKLRPSGNIIEGWQRIEAVITIPEGATSMNMALRSLGNTDVYFDDIRVHPFNASMKSFVYNPSNLRLMAELDENNYGSFYEYDNDGTLIRVKKETERGIKTIQETRSALYKEE